MRGAKRNRVGRRSQVGLPVVSRPYVYRVDSEGLFIDLAILIGMVILIIALIILQGWAMTKPLGYFMFGLYALFLVQAVCREYA